MPPQIFFSIKMLNRILITVILFFILTFASVEAHAPTSIELHYNLQQKVLSVEIKHQSPNPREHRIRKIRIYLNDDPPLELFLTHQTAPAYDKEEISLEAKEGDHIRVQAYCSQGGWQEAALVVVVPEDSSAK